LRGGGALGKLAPMSEQILVTRTDAVCELRFNRPEKRNAITFAMYEALYRGLKDAQADEAVRVVLFSGEGAGFCAGNDLHDFLDGPQFSPEHPVMGFLYALASFEKPLVAAVHGQTVGIGVTMLLHCDLVVAAHNTQLSMPFVKLGLVPEAASSLLLPHLVGPQRAAELLLLGKPFDAATAERLGLVNRVVADAAVLTEARALAGQLAAQPTGALQATRRLLRGDPGAVRAQIDAEARVFSAQLRSEEFRAGVRAFLAKARPG
jgi:enoyl-CoA hydratase/carnithine racemase